MTAAEPGDLIYCDPPYTHSQTISYGAQQFCLTTLFSITKSCQNRGVLVVLSIDGTKRTGNEICKLPSLSTFSSVECWSIAVGSC